MSFYFDDDNDAATNQAAPGAPGAGGTGGGDDNDEGGEFVCFNCGNTEGYLDGTTGELCCTQCYTQSQTTLRATQEELEMDEVMGMAARDRGGRVLGAAAQSGRSRRSSRMGLGGILSTNRRHPLEPTSRIVSLPELEDCLCGMQRVLYETSRIVCDLAVIGEAQRTMDEEEEEESLKRKEIKKKEYYDSVLRSIQTMWSNYLRAWSEGAEYYGAIHPDVRLCLRDSFYHSALTTHIHATLTHRTTQRVQDQHQQKLQEQQQLAQQLSTMEQDDMDAGNKNNNGNPSRLLKQKNGTGDAVLEGSYPNVVSEILEDDNSVRSDLTETEEAMAATATETDVIWNSHQSQKRLNNKQKSGPFTALQTMLAYHIPPGQERTFRLQRKEAALLLKPSMTMVASMLWMAVSPLGVSDTHICAWIANGSLPLVNAFSLLRPDEATILKPIADFFRMKKPPVSDLLQRTAATLQVACGYQPPKIRIRSPGTSNDITARRQEQQLEKVVDAPQSASSKTKKKRKKQSRPQPLPPSQPGRMLTPASVPMMTARFVSDLEFGQQVLNFSLALMGLPSVVPRHRNNDDNHNNKDTDTTTHGDTAASRHNNEYWLPPSLKAARPDLLLEPSHILGVIVVACRLVPGWDCWSYTRPLDHQTTGPQASRQVGPNKKKKKKHHGDFQLHQNSQDSDEDDHDDHREAKRRKLMEDQRRFVPWNEAHFRLLGNGKTMEGYLEFLEETMIQHTDVLLPEFVSLLDLSDDQSERMSSTSSSASPQQYRDDEGNNDHNNEREAVRPCPSLVAVLPEKANHTAMTTTPQRLQREDEESSDVDMPPANAQHHYELLKNPMARSTVTPGTHAPCSPHIGMLIEYMAYKAGVEPWEIEKFCIKLDQEIASRFANNPDVTDMHPLAVFHMADGTLKEKPVHIAESQLTHAVQKQKVDGSFRVSHRQ